MTASGGPNSGLQRRGRNHHPQDSELTAERSSPALRRGCTAAFTAADGGTERLMAEVSRSHLDRSGLLAAPAEERQDLLGDYLCGLVASACGTGTEEAADAPLLALGVDAYAVVSIQHSIETDLGVHLTVSDLAHAASIRLLAARLDERIGAGTTPAEVDVLAPVPPSGQAAPEKDVVRLYCWVGGSRVPGQAALSSDPVLCRDGRGLEGTTAMGIVKQSVAVQ